jgi:Tfp pilus assembly protein PilX
MEGSRRRLGILLTVVVAVVGIAGVRWHLQDWRRAAAVRDRVLASASSQLQETRCATVGFISIPDSVGGAYVFRNGFEDALARGQAYPAKPMVGQAKEPNCTLKWDGESFGPVGR